MVEGVKDAAALLSLDYLAVGLHTKEMPTKFSRLFRGADVVVVPDLDKAAEEGSKKTCATMYGVAESPKVTRLPEEYRATDGDDV